MRALFILLLIYFLSGILQITGGHTFATKDSAYSAETCTTEIECIVSSDFDLCDSILENLEDNDNKILAFQIKNTNSGTFPRSINSSSKHTTTAVFKAILIHHTNLPPPAFTA